MFWIVCDVNTSCNSSESTVEIFFLLILENFRFKAYYASRFMVSEIMVVLADEQTNNKEYLQFYRLLVFKVQKWHRC